MVGYTDFISYQVGGYCVYPLFLRRNYFDPMRDFGDIPLLININVIELNCHLFPDHTLHNVTPVSVDSG